MTDAVNLLFDGVAVGAEAAIVEGQTGEFACLPPQGSTLRLQFADQRLDAFLRPGAPTWYWRLPPQRVVGSFAIELCIEWPDQRLVTLHTTLHVRPRKIDAERYHALLDDLQQIGRTLVLAFSGGTVAGDWSSRRSARVPHPSEDVIALFGSDFDRFGVAAERLLRRPPDHLRPSVVRVEPGQARDLGALDLTRLDLVAGPLNPDATAAMAQHLATIPERQSQADYDSSENRLLKRTLTLLARRAGQLQAQPGLPPTTYQRLALIVEHLRTLRAHPILQSVAALSHVVGPSIRMQRDPDQRAVLRMWQLLRRHPHIEWEADTLALPIQDLPKLYERWCALQVGLILLRLPGWQHNTQAIAHQDMDDDSAWALRLTEGGTLLCCDGPAGSQLRLHYQPRYQPGGSGFCSLDRHTRVPDLALELSHPGTATSLIVLDAKYRLDASGGVPADALADAYSYLGSIGNATGRRAVLAVALLYPGEGVAEFYASGTAAIPLLPGVNSELAGWLERMVGGAFERMGGNPKVGVGPGVG